MYRALKYPWLRLGAAASAAAACAAIILGLLWGSTAEAQPRSSLLEDALRQELQLEDGEPIPMERLGEVEQLLVCGEALMGTLQEHEEQVGFAHDRYAAATSHGDICDDDLALLAQCTNLRVLILDYQQISDVSPLAELPLEYLSPVSYTHLLNSRLGIVMVMGWQNATRNVTATRIPRYGKEGRTTSPMPLLATFMVQNRFIPKGGVISPICVHMMAMMPKWMAGIPKTARLSASMGPRITMTATQSIKQPSTNLSLIHI